MAINLPNFRSVRLRHKNPKPEDNGVLTDDASPAATKAPSLKDGDNTVQLSGPRKWLTILACVLLFIAFIFLILVLTAQTSVKPVLMSTWFIKINLSNILVRSTTPGSEFPLLNSIARSLGLHDFYLVGLWNYCEGYTDEGITNCSKPTSLYYFNPVKILLSELLAGATITLPSDILTILRLIQIASNVMFILFLLGIIFTFLSLLSPLSLLRSPHFSPRPRSCWVGCGLGLISFLAAFCTTVAAVVGTVMFTIMRNVLRSQPMLNIGAELGVQMLAFMWVAAGSVLFAFVMQARCCCCCRNGRKEKKRARRREKEMSGEAGRSPGFIEHLRRRGRVSEA